MREGAPEPRHRYEGLRRAGIQALEAWRLEEARERFQGALELARELGDEGLVDRAFCNRAAVAIELGDGREELGALRSILLRNADGESCFLAAYNIARAYELAKEFKKGKFYARIARDHALAADSPLWIAFSHNRLGNLLLAESFLAEATAEYEEALGILDRIGIGPTLERAKILDNLGYCRVLSSRLEEGFRLLYTSLRMLRRLPVREALISTHLDLSFAHLEARKYRAARRHGLRALGLARECQDRDSVKNALYLLGEAANLSGDAEAARGYFGRLQGFFPDMPFIADLLLTVDVRKMINLKA